MQKFVVGREIIKVPRVLVVSQPTGGVDIGAAVFIRAAMLDLVAKGSAVVMISQDLEEIFAISHRIAVLHDGVLSTAESATKLTAEKVGLLMGGSDAPKDAAQDAPIFSHNSLCFSPRAIELLLISITLF